MPLLQAQSIIASQALIFREIQHEAQNNQTTTRTPRAPPLDPPLQPRADPRTFNTASDVISFNSRGARDL